MVALQLLHAVLRCKMATIVASYWQTAQYSIAVLYYTTISLH